MKDKIIMLIIGFLLGAIIATGVFYLYTSNNSNDCVQSNIQMDGQKPPEMPNGQEPPAKPDGEPPEKPSGENGQPPAKPGESNTQNNDQNSNN